jgi:DNA-binding response OmpR family regulator
MSMSDEPIPNAASGRTPTVYFIDDSATMREVVKIAFRKEAIHVVTCPDAASALAQFGETAPDAVITDVIMPDKDGYQVCEFIKQQERFAKTPVILMSGIVNRSVAERATAVKADELIRKPFQPQELISRVKKLLNPQSPPALDAALLKMESRSAERENSNPLRGLFAAGSPPSSNHISRLPRSEAPVAVAPKFSSHGAPSPRAASTSASGNADLQKLRNEVWRLELLVKKLQADLEAQRQYCTALEAHLSTLQETE